ncbi:C6 transcription factor [Colletotrichum asianum]
MPDQSLRRLLPAPKTPLPALSRPPPAPSRKRATATKVACNACRAKKKACDGKRPACSSCVELNVACAYVSVDEKETPAMALKRENQALKAENEANKRENEVQKRKNQALESMLAQLSYMSPEAMARTVKEFKFAVDPNAPLRSITPSGLDPRRFLPQLHTNVEFELMRDYPTAYPISGNAPRFSSPESTDSRPSKMRRITEASDSASSSPEPSTVFSNVSVAGSSSGETSNESMVLPSSTSSFFSVESIRPPPIQTDPRLKDLDITHWTAVSIPSDVAANVISLYLETDHAILGLFDTELFVHDLTHYEYQFCSPLLVSALLAFACQAYAAYDPDASGWSHEFQAEADRLWRADREDSLTTIAALAFLIQSVGCNGDGELDVQYIKDTAAMAKRMKLFGTPASCTTEDLGKLSEEDARAKAQVAWGVFSNLSMASQFYLPATTEYPPALPIPGKDPIVHAGTRSESPDSAASGSRRKRSEPPRGAATFAALCELWVISSRLTWYYQHDTGPGKAAKGFALQKYQKLLSWAANLPEGVTRNEHSPGHVLVCHMLFHGTILYLFRPFIPTEQQHTINSWSPSAPAVPSIFAASLEQLKSLVDTYMTLPQRTYSIFWHIALMHVANAAANDASDPDGRHYFFKCIYAYLGLYRSFAVAGVIAQGLLGMAVKKGTLNAAEGYAIWQEFRATDSQRSSGQSVAPTGLFVTDLNLAVRDREAARVDRLIEEFNELTLLEEFTVGVT